MHLSTGTGQIEKCRCSSWATKTIPPHSKFWCQSPPTKVATPGVHWLVPVSSPYCTRGGKKKKKKTLCTWISSSPPAKVTRYTYTVCIGIFLHMDTPSWLGEELFCLICRKKYRQSNKIRRQGIKQKNKVKISVKLWKREKYLTW